MDDEIDLSNAELLLDGNRGIYIPQHFAEDAESLLLTGVSDTDLDELALGPDYEGYWETWNDVLNNARIQHPTLGMCWLHQDGDVWLIPCYPTVGEKL